MWATERAICAAAFLWAAVLLTAQFVRALRGRQPDLSVAAGSGGRGALYNVTVAMSPSHKETARRHPVAFGAGVLLHAGIAVAVIRVCAVLIAPGAPPLFGIPGMVFSGVTALTGLSLLARRAASPALRVLSSPDDYVAAALTTAFLAAGAARDAGLVPVGVYVLAAAAFALYLPLGKLRHVLFCPVSRLELGARLGRRGTFPPAREVKDVGE